MRLVRLMRDGITKKCPSLLNAQDTKKRQENLEPNKEHYYLSTVPRSMRGFRIRSKSMSVALHDVEARYERGAVLDPKFLENSNKVGLHGADGNS